MKKTKEELDFTTNSRVYKMLKRVSDLSCSYCPPNKGCNGRRKNDAKRNWKNYRKTKNKV